MKLAGAYGETVMSPNNIVLCSESRELMDESLVRWKCALKRTEVKVSKSKTEYMCMNERETGIMILNISSQPSKATDGTEER